MSFKRQHISFNNNIRTVLTICLILFGIEILNIFTGRYLNQFGLIPRNSSALYGIIFSPFLHASLWHFLSNITPLAVFSFFMLQHGSTRFILVTISCIFTTGALVWIFGRTATHVGASGLVYAYFGYLLLAGILSREIKLVLISLFIGFIYGGLMFRILPGAIYISWESHLFGFVSGLGCALLWAKEKPTSNLNQHTET
jgi:membrane associated rhomboid family serine protease